MGEDLEKSLSVLGGDQPSRTNLEAEEGGFPASAFKVRDKWAVFVQFSGVAGVDIGLKRDRELEDYDPFEMVPDKGEVGSEISGDEVGRDGWVGDLGVGREVS